MNGTGPRNFRSPSHESTLETLTKTIEGLEEKIFGRSMAPNKPVLPGDKSYASDKQAIAERTHDRSNARQQDYSIHYGYPSDHLQDSTARTLRDEIRMRQAKLSANASSDHNERSSYTSQPDRTAGPHTTYASPYKSPGSTYPNPTSSGTSANHDLSALLSELRRELRNDIKATMSEGFIHMQRDVDALKSAANQQQVPLSIREDLEKIAHSINQFDHVYMAQTGPNGSQQAIDSLRLEVDSLRNMIDKVAREETLTSLDNRWGSIERNLRDFQPTLLHSDVSSLAGRLDEIRSAIDVAAQPEPVLQPLADKVEHIALAISELLDRGQSGLDRQHLNDFGTQMDARLNQLVDKVDRLVTSDQSDMTGRIDKLSKRLDELMSEGMLANLEERIANLQHLVEQGASSSDLPLVNIRLQELSDKMDAMNGRASSIETAGIERLVGQLAQIADQLDTHKSAQHDSGGFQTGLGRVEAQLEEIRHRFDQSVDGAPSSDLNILHDRTEQVLNLVRNLSTDDIDDRLNALQEHLASNDDFILEAARQAAEEALKAADIAPAEGFDSDAERAFLLSLSDEVKALDQMQRQRDDESRNAFKHVHETLYKIVDRLDHIGGVEPLERPQEQDSSEFLAPIDDNSVLETPSRRKSYEGDSTQRAALMPNSADSLVTAEQIAEDRAVADHSMPNLAPDLPSEPTEPAEAKHNIKAPVMAENTAGAHEDNHSQSSMLNSMAGRMRQDAAIAEDDMVDQPLEPGSGAPDLNSIMQKVQEVQRSNHRKKDDQAPGHADPEQNIAAVRRAALIAAAEAAKAQEAEEAARKAEKAANKKPLIRKPILIAGTIALLAILAFPAVMTFVGNEAPEEVAIVSDANIADQEGANGPVLTDAQPNEQLVDANNAQQPDAANGFSEARDVANSGFLPSTQEPVQNLNETAPVSGQVSGAPLAQTGADYLAAKDLPNEIAPQPLRTAAENGDPLALYEIGARFADGRGTLVDTNQAINWFDMAAEQDFAPAQYRLGNIYEKGIGVEQDVALAKDYYRDAAANGHVKSMHNLGVIYASNGEHQDLTLAAEWFKRGADYGVKDSQVNIGILYARGDGVDRNLVESYKWFAIAAKNGDNGAADMRDQVLNALPQTAAESAQISVDNWQALPVDVLVNDVQVPDSWNGEDTNTASIDVRKAIRNIQAILNNNGFDAGPADGVIGKQTIAAIKQFQAAIGMEPNGEVSDELVRELLSRNG